MTHTQTSYTARILVVDDEPEVESLIVQRFRKEIQAGKYAFLFALNGRTGLEILHSNPAVDVVLTDINMPGMNGIDFLERINAMNHTSMKTIVVSAYDDMTNIRAAMNRGAFDFITKPVNFNDLQITMEKTLQQVELLKETGRMREELRKNADQRQRQQEQFTLRLLLAQEEERKRMAAELHDSLGQQLLIIRNRALLGMQDGKTIDRGRHLHEISEMAALTLDEVRRIAHNLRPYQLDRFGLTDAIISAVESAAKASGIELIADVANIDAAVSDGMDIGIFRIIQECINNIIRHSRAKNALIRVHPEDDHILIQVEDDGQGFDAAAGVPEKESGFGFGLNGMQERVNLFHGSFIVDSNPGKGAVITIQIPSNHDTR